MDAFEQNASVVVGAAAGDRSVLGDDRVLAAGDGVHVEFAGRSPCDRRSRRMTDRSAGCSAADSIADVFM